MAIPNTTGIFKCCDVTYKNDTLSRFEFNDDKLVVLNIAYYFIMTACIIGNVTVIVAIAKHTRLHNVTNVFIVCLASSDIIQSLIVAPGFTITQNIAVQSEFICLLLYMCPSLVSIALSLNMLLCIATERYIAIAKPLHYSQIVTKRRVKITLIFSSLLAMLVGSLPLFGWNNISKRPKYGPHAWSSKNCVPVLVLRGSYCGAILIGTCCPLILAVAWLYGKIFMTARRHANAMKSLSVGTGTVKEGKISSKRKKGIIVLLMMVVISVLAWTPLVLLFSYEFYFFTVETVFEPRSSEYFHTFAIGLVYGSTAVNPYLYGLANKEVRNIILRMVLPCWKSREIYPESFAGVGSIGSEAQPTRIASIMK